MTKFRRGAVFWRVSEKEGREPKRYPASEEILGVGTKKRIGKGPVWEKEWRPVKGRGTLTTTLLIQGGAIRVSQP